MNILTPVRFKSLKEVQKQCKRQKVPYSIGKESIVVGAGKGRGLVCYTPFNGRFFGHTPRGIFFESSARTYDRHPWMQQLRAFFHQEVTK